MATKGVATPTRTIPIPVSAIQTPTSDGSNHATILRQVKESIEVASRQRGDPGFSYVRANELVALGLATMVNGALQLAGGAVANPVSGVIGGVSGPGGGGPGTVGATGAPGVRGSPGLDGYDGEDGLTIPGLKGATGAAGAAGIAGKNGAFFWPDDPDDPLLIPGPTGAKGAAGAAGLAGASSPVVTWPDDPDDSLFVPGSVGATGAAGAAGTNANPHLWPDDPDDSVVIPGPIGLRGLVGPIGPISPLLYPDDVDDILVVPGPIGLTGTAGPAGQLAPFLYPDDVDDALVIPGPIGVTGAVGPASAQAHIQWPDDVDDAVIIPGPIGLTGTAGPAGQIAPFLYPDDVDDLLLVPGVPGAAGVAGIAGAVGNVGPYLIADNEFDETAHFSFPQAQPGNTTMLVDLTAAPGVSNMYMRADAGLAIDQTIAPTWTGVHTFSAMPTIRIPGATHPVFNFKTLGISTTNYIALEAENAQGIGIAMLVTDDTYVGAPLTGGPTGGQVYIESYGGGSYPVAFGVDGIFAASFNTTGCLFYGDNQSVAFHGAAGLTQLAIGSIFGVYGSGSKLAGAIYSAYPISIYASNAVATAPVAIFHNNALVLSGAFCDSSTLKIAPLTTGSATVGVGVSSVVMTPAATIASFTLTLPSAGQLNDGTRMLITTSQTITLFTLTLGAGTTYAFTVPTTITSATPIRMQYNGTNAKWYLA